MAEKESFFDYVLAPFKGWYNYIKDNAAQYYIQLLKIHLLKIFAGLGLLLFFALIAAGILMIAGGTGVFTDAESMIATLTLLPVLLSLGLLFIISMIVIGWVSNSIALTAVIYTNTEFEKGKFSIMESFKRIKGKVFRYLVAQFVIWIVILLPVIIVGLLMIGGFAALSSQDSEGRGFAIFGMILALPVAMLLLIGYLFFAQLLYGLFAQFWVYGFLLENMGIRASLRRSVDIVLKKPVKVIVFGILLYIGAVAFGAPLMIYSVFFQFAIRMLVYVGVVSEHLILWLFILVIPIHTIIVGVLSAIVQAFNLPSHYLFWKKVRKDTI